MVGAFQVAAVLTGCLPQEIFFLFDFLKVESEQFEAFLRFLFWPVIRGFS